MPIRFDNVGIQRKMLKNESLTFFDMFPQLAKQKRDLAFPFIIYLGNVNNTEYGETPGQVNISDFTTFKKIFTGKDSNLAIWENSTSLVKTSDTTARRTYQVGKYIYLYRTGKSTTNLITPTNEVINAIQQESQTDISFILEGQSLSKNDLFKLWTIPTQGTNEFFLISSITEYVDSNQPDRIIYTDISFTSLNDRLSNSGQQIEQYVNLGAPGEGYAFPKIINISAIEREVILDPQRLKNRGATEIQIEIFGPAIITAFWAMGRRVKENSFEVVAPRHLFGYKANSPYSTDFNQKTSAESSYYWIQAGEVDSVSFYTDWKSNVSSQYDPSQTRNYEGYIKTDKLLTEATNDPVSSQFGQNFNIWDQDWIINISGFEQPKRVIDTRAVKYAEDNINFPTNGNISTYLMLNAIAFLDVEKLPISIIESTVWTTKNIPIIGFFANILTLGYPIGWTNTNSKIQAKLINGITPKALYDITANGANNGIDDGGDGTLPMEALRADTADTAGGVIGTNAIGSTLNISLTDKVIKESGSNVILNTVDLGQEEGWLFKGTEIPADPALETMEGFVLDFINLKMIGKADIKITAYRYGTSIWSGYFQSRSKFTTSVREWSNSYKLSAWEEINNEVATYPAAIPDPDTITNEYDNIVLTKQTIILNEKLTWQNKQKFINGQWEFIIIDLELYGYTWLSFLSIYGTMSFNIGYGNHFFENLYNDDATSYADLTNLDAFNEENEEGTILYQYDISGSGTLNYYYRNSNSIVSQESIKDFVSTYYLSFSIFRRGNKLMGRLNTNHSNLNSLNFVNNTIEEGTTEVLNAISDNFESQFTFYVR